MIEYRRTWLRIAKLGDLKLDKASHLLRHCYASLAADLSFSDPTIASLLGHTTHSITGRYVHTADAALLAVANATMKLVVSDQAQPQLR
jgi:integrase